MSPSTRCQPAPAGCVYASPQVSGLHTVHKNDIRSRSPLALQDESDYHGCHLLHIGQAHLDGDASGERFTNADVSRQDAVHNAMAGLVCERPVP
jgi:hypothetical protein